MRKHSCVFQRTKKKDTCCVVHSGNSEENLRTAIARKVAIAPKDFEVNCSMVIFFAGFKKLMSVNRRESPNKLQF